ncbi:hypothetical protein [Streptomyces sp. HD]|uniref:hypothetical protein n=1 Tax=Streptomyces sp. HD TaxID=3020892 RepID=UPI00232DE32A|nr:hypothetical protein [Streptomyces sp. HD]MDC0774060.1 hypothetical protein [Streptomyces sp. HD]
MTNGQPVEALADRLPMVSAPVMASGTAAAMPRNSRRDARGGALIRCIQGVGKRGRLPNP